MPQGNLNEATTYLRFDYGSTMTSIKPALDFENLEPRADAVARLLILLAKSELTTDQQQAARVLALQVVDWDEFTSIAAKKFSITFAHRHLQKCAKDLVPPQAMERMRLIARASAMSTLRVVAAQTAFHRDCIQTSRAKHAYVKGVTLSQQCGQRSGERYCRDIDVLIAAEDFERVLKTAVAAGYRALLDEDTGRFAVTAQDLVFLGRYADVVTLIAPGLVSIEMHRRLDKLSLNFDLKAAISTAEEVEVSGVTLKTLAMELHFVYVCYHHSRHFWSHLHWLADLDAMARSLESQKARVRDLADKIGILPTIDAAFEFQRLISNPQLWGDKVPVETGGGQFLKACLVNLEGDLDLERQLRGGMTLSDFMSAWQISPGRQGALWFNSWLRRLRPSVSQYVGRSYPAQLQWIYSLENAIGLAKNGLALAGNAMHRLPGSLAQKFTRSSKRLTR